MAKTSELHSVEEGTENSQQNGDIINLNFPDPLSTSVKTRGKRDAQRPVGQAGNEGNQRVRGNHEAGRENGEGHEKRRILKC